LTEKSTEKEKEEKELVGLIPLGTDQRPGIEIIAPDTIQEIAEIVRTRVTIEKNQVNATMTKRNHQEGMKSQLI
jgi:hypothetical protein